MAIQLQYKDDSLDLIARREEDGLAVRRDFFDLYAEDLKEASKALALAFANGSRVFLCGAGTSHAVAEILAGRFINPEAPDRAPLPAMPLSAAPQGMPSPENGADGDRIFARQLEAFGQDGDVLVIFSSDGQSPRLAEAARTAREQGMFILGATGGDGGTLSAEDLLDVELRVPSIEESLVQELHVAIACLMSELCDYYLYTKPEILREMLQAGAGIPGDEDAGKADGADPAQPSA